MHIIQTQDNISQNLSQCQTESYSQCIFLDTETARNALDCLG